MNRSRFEKLSSSVQKLLASTAKQAAASGHKSYAALVTYDEKVMKQNGVTVTGKVDVAAFKDIVPPLYKEFQGSIGKSLIEEAQAATAGK
jgi:TRAP-type C4-dicarboxylate transport system substrate-binding protein